MGAVGPAREPVTNTTRSRVKQPRERNVLALALAGTGAGLLIAATFAPVNGGGRSGYAVSIFDSSAPKQLQLFALEPVGVGVIVLALVVTALVHGGAWCWLGGAFLAFGVQSALLFLAYFGGAAFGNAEYNSFRIGSLLGLAGAALLALGGLVLMWRRRSSLSGSAVART